MIGGILAGVACAGALAHGVYHRNSPLFGRVLHEVPGSGRRAALTFDDGPHPDWTPMILDALRARGAPATFFVLGRHAMRWPELVRRIAEDGHEIGNHGFFHRKLHVRTPGYIRDDLARGRDAIQAAAGVTPRFFRAPHGVRNPWVSRIAAALGERTVGWTLGVWDTDNPGADVVAERVLRGTRPGSIVLLHDADGYDPDGVRRDTALALPRILDGLLERGYTIEPLPAPAPAFAE